LFVVAAPFTAILTLNVATDVLLLAIIIELPIADVEAGTVYNAVSVVAAGLDCPSTLYVVAIIILPLIKMVI
jgi:hypothetical protein